MRLKRKKWGIVMTPPTLQPLFENEQTNCQIIDLFPAQRNRHRFSLSRVVGNRQAKNIAAYLQMN